MTCEGTCIFICVPPEAALTVYACEVQGGFLGPTAAASTSGLCLLCKNHLQQMSKTLSDCECLGGTEGESMNLHIKLAPSG